MNAFEALCNLASKEHWCWKMYCTTCGTMHLRYSLQEIAKGLSPEDTNWIIKKRDTRYKDRLGALPKINKSDIKEKILEVCIEEDISLISEN